MVELYIHTLGSHNKNTIFTSFPFDVVLNFVMYKISPVWRYITRTKKKNEKKRKKEKIRRRQAKKSNQRINFPTEKTNRYRLKKLLVFMYPNISVRAYPPIWEFTLHFETFEFRRTAFSFVFLFVFRNFFFNSYTNYD